MGDDGGEEGKLKKPLLLDADDGVSPPSPKTNFGGQMKNPLAGGLIADPC